MLIDGDLGAGGPAVEYDSSQPISADVFDSEQPTSSDGFDMNGEVIPTNNEPKAPVDKETPVDPAPAETPVEAKFTTPDGRQLSAEEFQNEYRQLNSEFTRRSQELSRLQKAESEFKNRPDYSNLSDEERQAHEILDGIKRDAVSEAKAQIAPMLEEMKVQKEIEDLKGKYDDFNADDVIGYALDNRISDLDQAYKIMNYESNMDKAKAAARLETETRLTRRGPGAGMPSQGNQGASPKTGLQRYDKAKDQGKSTRELLEEGLAELGI